MNHHSASRFPIIGESQYSMSRVSNRRGFTLVELLVCITIIIVLTAIAFTSVNAIRLSALKAKDMHNLRNLSSAAMAAGSDNGGRLPTIHGNPNPGGTPYKLQAREILESFGINKESCYAPTRAVWGGAPNYEWWYMSPTTTATHYVYFANDGETKNKGWFMSGTIVPPDRNEYHGATPYEDIIKDKSRAFARSATDDVWYPILWAGICRDFGGSPRVTAFMKDGEPLGVNTMYLDGHAKWVPAADMKERFSGAVQLLW